MPEPQQARSRATRQRLLDACVESLAEVGWAGTSVVAVAARAGVSRGAAQHHFTTRADLVRAALESTVIGLRDRLLAQGDSLKDHPNRPLAVIEMLAELWTSQVGRAATHLWVAASTEPELREMVLSLERPFNQRLFSATAELLDADLSTPETRASVRLTIDLSRAFGLGELLRKDLTSRKAEMAQWAAVLGTLPGIGSGFAA